MCAGCDSYHPWSAVIVSSISGLVYIIFSNLALRNKLDDPLDAFAVHAGAGTEFGGTFWYAMTFNLFCYFEIHQK